jgi:predicted tellurium resistance membrane protein TerC
MGMLWAESKHKLFTMLAAKPKPKLSSLLFFIAFSLAVPAIFSFKVCLPPAMFCLLLGSLVESVEIVADKNQKHQNKNLRRNASKSNLE